jgi:hypothetical protein
MNRRKLLKIVASSGSVLGTCFDDHTREDLDNIRDTADVADNSISESPETGDEDAATVELTIELY